MNYSTNRAGNQFLRPDQSIRSNQGNVFEQRGSSSHSRITRMIADLTGGIRRDDGQPVLQPSRDITTLAIGEEDGGGLPPPKDTVTTLAMGEEDGGSFPPPKNIITTLAMGEEDGYRLPPHRGITLAMGEDGRSFPPHRGITQALGEDGRPFLLPRKVQLNV